MTSNSAPNTAPTTPTGTTKPETWLQRITESEVSQSLNRIHNEVTDLFKVKPEHLDGNELKEDIMEKLLASVVDLPLDTMATVCPVTDNIEILHHTTKLGSDILNKEVIYFSLMGKGKTAVPVTYKPKSILKLAEVQCPT